MLEILISTTIAPIPSKFVLFYQRNPLHLQPFQLELVEDLRETFPSAILLSGKLRGGMFAQMCGLGHANSLGKGVWRW